MPLLRKMMGLLSLVVALFLAARIHLRIHSAIVDPRLHVPVGWWATGFGVSLALIIFYYLQKFDEQAGDP